MTNYERYEKELTEIWKTGNQFAVADNNPVPCAKCEECEFYKKEGPCNKHRAEWVKEQYGVKASTLPVDTKVICSQTEHSEKYRRYFAKLENGKIECFMNGLTSWTVDRFSNTVIWGYVTLEDGTIVLPE